jgi:hypothetical protein
LVRYGQPGPGSNCSTFGGFRSLIGAIDDVGTVVSQGAGTLRWLLRLNGSQQQRFGR